jgi:predicted nucleic acid-binding protein
VYTKKPIAVIDACLIYPAGMRNTLMWLAWHKIYYPKWSEDIHREWMGHLAKDRPDLTEKDLSHIKTEMDTNLHGNVRDYEHLIEQLTLPDPKDRHVLAVAIKSNAGFIVTENMKDFPSNTLTEYGVKAIRPDNFIMELVAIDKEKCLESFRTQLSKMQKPPMEPEEFLQSLLDKGLRKTVEFLEPYVNTLKPKRAD